MIVCNGHQEGIPTERQACMRAFDSLPAAVRRAIAYADLDLETERLVEWLKSGEETEQSLIALIRRAGKEHHHG